LQKGIGGIYEGIGRVMRFMVENSDDENAWQRKPVKNSRMLLKGHFPRYGECPFNPALGQCAITAFLMQDFFGGKVYGLSSLSLLRF